MGFDKLISFFNKNFSNISEELYDIPQVVTNHVYFDMNFIIYNCISELEKEINKIIMIILGVSYTDIIIINQKLKKIFDKFHWSKLNVCMNDILDGNNIDEILINFKKFLDDNVNELLCWYLYNNLNHQIINTHPLQFIKSINLFFDGIPTYAKIIEQRRRRVKNYLESKNRKKLFNKYFKNIINSIIVEDDIMFDYFDWINNFYTFDKSIGPYSPILIKLSQFINIKMNENYKNIKIYINNSINYGESDYKIFKHIIDESMDCSIAIHSCDSDFIFLILWYQLISTTKYIDTNLMFINYNYNKDNEYNKTVYFGKKIMNSILDKYATINGLNENISINIIFDFLALILLFGNDIIPLSYELGPELSLKQIFESHYPLYINSLNIINLNNINIINFTNLAKWLENIKSSNSLSVIILNRFYKMNYNNILLLVDKHKTLDEISKNINNNDLVIQNKSFYIENNTYQTLYNYIMFEAENMIDDEFNRNYKKFYDDIKDSNNQYIKITKNVNVKNYLTQYISLNQIFFLNFNLYTPHNTIFCDDSIAPSIDMIIQFINLNDMNNLQKKTNDILKNLNNEIYFNSVSHHLFITPYILDSSHFNNLNLKYIDSLMNVVSNKINGIWLDYNNVDTFNLKKIDPYKYINICNELIKFYQDNFIDRFFIDNNRLLQ
jgi:hypothetical protein